MRNINLECAKFCSYHLWTIQRGNTDLWLPKMSLVKASLLLDGNMDDEFYDCSSLFIHHLVALPHHLCPLGLSNFTFMKKSNRRHLHLLDIAIEGTIFYGDDFVGFHLPVDGKTNGA